MQSGDGDPFVPINHRIEIEFLRYINLRRISTSRRLKKPPNATVKGDHNVGDTLRMRILDTYDSRTAENKQYSIQDAFTSHGTKYSRKSRHAVPIIAMNVRGRKRSCRLHILRMDKDG